MALENDWIKVLYKPFLQSIHGEYLKTMSSFELSEDLFYIAQRAIAAFRFPKVSLDYTPHYVLYTDNALLQEQDQIIDADEDTVNPNLVHSAEFTNTIDFTTIQVILAWMKVYGCEEQISNADNFTDMYTDSNITTFSRANALDKYTKLLQNYRDYAKDLESRYYSVKDGQSTLGDITKDE